MFFLQHYRTCSIINSQWKLTGICQGFGVLRASTPLSLPKSHPALGFGSNVVSTVAQVAISLSSHSQWCLCRPAEHSVSRR